MSARTDALAIGGCSQLANIAAAPGHTSVCFPGTNSASVPIGPCSRLSMPSAIASGYVIEQRCPVTLSPRLCASAIAAPSSARVMFLYALNDVAP